MTLDILNSRRKYFIFKVIGISLITPQTASVLLENRRRVVDRLLSSITVFQLARLVFVVIATGNRFKRNLLVVER